MAVNKGFLDFVVEQLEGCGPIATRGMFGGAGIYAGEVFFAIVDDDVLYLKVDDDTRGDFVRAGGRPFDPYGDGRKSRQYYGVPASILEDADAMTAWGRKAIAAAVRARAGSSTRGRPRSR